MKSDKKVVILNCDDWEGLYIDGELKHEDHRISPENILEALGIECETVECDLDWFDELGELPENLENVRLYGEKDQED